MRLLVLLAIAILTGCASTQFRALETRSANVFEGNGGTKEVVNGVDFWSTGEPPRKFKVLGLIDDERSSAVVPMAMKKSDIAAKAKESGGDAVVELSSSSKITGIYSQSTARANVHGSNVAVSSTGYAVPVGKSTSRYAVIKYLD